MTLFILLAIVVAGIVLFYLVKRSSGFTEKGAIRPTPYGRDELRIENVGPGGVLQLSRVGSDMEDFDVKVVAKHVYQENGFTWYELEGDRGGKKVWLEWEDDDELVISITLKKLTLSDLHIDKQDLQRIDDEEEGEITYEGQKYYYEDSGKAVFLRHGDAQKAEKFYYWDFEASDEEHAIGVERWGQSDYDVSYVEYVKPSQITVYSLRETSAS